LLIPPIRSLCKPSCRYRALWLAGSRSEY
jgi:hypothetical protein